MKIWEKRVAFCNCGGGRQRPPGLQPSHTQPCASRPFCASDALRSRTCPIFPRGANHLKTRIEMFRLMDTLPHRGRRRSRVRPGKKWWPSPESSQTHHRLPVGLSVALALSQGPLEFQCDPHMSDPSFNLPGSIGRECVGMTPRKTIPHGFLKGDP